MKFCRNTLLFVFLFAVSGCVTSDILENPRPLKNEEEVEQKLGFWHQTFGATSGVDARAREIEKDLGL